MLRIRPLIFTLLVATCMSGAFAQTGGDQDKRWSDLRKESTRLYMQRNLDAAISAEKQALAIAENASPNDPRIIMSVLAMANLYQLQSKYTESIPLYERAVAISDKGPENARIRSTFNELATAYKAVGRDSEAAKYTERAAAASNRR